MRALIAPETFNLGETTRGIEVGRALRSRGHDVQVMGYSRRFADLVQAAGLPLRLESPELTDGQADQFLAADQGRSLRHPFTRSMLRARVATERALIAQWRPDVIVIGSTLSLFLSARAAGVPLVYVKPFAMSLGHVQTLREFPITAGRGPLTAGVNRAAGAAVRRVALASRWRPRSFRVVARELGVRLPVHTLAAIEADLNLIASIFPALDRRPLPPRNVAVGPIHARLDIELPAPVRELARRRRPAVHVGLGSSADRHLALGILAEVARLDVDVVTSAGPYLTPADRRSLPDNVHVFDLLPAHRLAGLIDASVIHGGEGTVQSACAAGVPFAGIGLQAEQRWNIDECVRYGNAVRFTGRDVRRGRLTAMVDRMLADDALAKSARRLAADVAGLDGPGEAARRIEDFVR